MKKICSIVLLVVFLISLLQLNLIADSNTSEWDGSTITQPSKIVVVDKIFYYEISTAEELAYIAKTSGEWLSYNYILTDDIILNSVELTYDENGNLTVDPEKLNEWPMISNFKGVFNGNGHKVSGVYINVRSDEVGFFSYCRGNVYNLTITNSYIKGKNEVGGICGLFAETGKEMTNCYYDGAVVGESSVGGLIGRNNCTTISNCGNYGDVWGTSDYVAGIVGKFYAYGIDNCFNKGNIYSAGYFVAGIAGSSSIYSITDCLNTGNVTGISFVGGICGSINGADIQSCGNLANISGQNYVGGICGRAKYYSNESSMSVIYFSYNAGEVSGTEYVGGITGYTDYAHVLKSYNIGNVTGESNAGAIVGYSGSIWGKGKVTYCCYLKEAEINSDIYGFGNVQFDLEGVTVAKDKPFFCINDDGTININGHTYTDEFSVKCSKCGLERIIEIEKGDFTDDGKVTLDDAIYLLYHTFNPTGYPLNQPSDFTGDGKVTLDDAIYLLYHTFNPTGYPLEK